MASSVRPGLSASRTARSASGPCDQPSATIPWLNLDVPSERGRSVERYEIGVTVCEQPRRRSWSWLATIFAALLAGGFAIGGALIGAGISSEAAVTPVRQSAGSNCLAFQDWAIERMDDGMSSAAIARFAKVAIDSATVERTVSATTTTPAETERIPYYTACGYGDEVRIAAFLDALRGQIPRLARRSSDNP